jgi:alanine racemase
MAEGEPAIEVDTGASDNVPAPLSATEGAPTNEAGGILTVDLGAIEANWRALSRRAMPAECSAVIKADGYGCGIEKVAVALARAGCRTFFVADLMEARRVRSAVSEPTIYVLNGLLLGNAPQYAQIRARPVIGSMVELAEWDAFVSTNQWHGGAALHVDTGMNRLGISVNEAAALAPRIRAESHGITLLMSHLACAEEPNHPLNAQQMSVFREVRFLYRGIPSSLANSSGIFLGSSAHCDMVRPGVALYGVNPIPGQPNPMRPVIELQARIVQVRNVPRGELDRQARDPGGGGGGRLCRRLSARGQRLGRRARRRHHRRRQALSARRSRVDGPSGDRHYRSPRRRRPPRRFRYAHRR